MGNSLKNRQRHGKAYLSVIRVIDDGRTGEDCVPSGDGLVDELLDETVDLGVLLRVEVVDVAGEAHRAVVLKGQIGREPLVVSGPIDVIPGPLLSRWHNLALARPLVYGIGDSNDLILDEL